MMKKLAKIIITVLVLVAVMLFAVACAQPTDGNKKAEIKYTVMTPDGAPSMAIAKMMKDNATFGRTPTYSIIGSTAVASSFTNGDADFIIAPTNAGIMLSNRLKTYKMVAVTSWGNLYVVGSSTQKTLTECADIDEFLAQFNGKTIASVGTGMVPDVTFKHILTTKGIDATMSASDAQLIQSDLADGKIEFAVLGEPAVTGTLVKVSTAKRLCSVSDLWKIVTGTEFTQAGLFVKTSIIESDREAVESFLNELKSSIEYLNASKENAQELGSYMEATGTSTLKGAIVSKCYSQMSQKYVLAEEVKADVLAFVKVLGVSVEDDADLFYTAK